MKWDRDKHGYVDERNILLTPEEVQDQVEAYVQKQKRKIEKAALLLLAGSIGLAAFFDLLELNVRVWHQTTGAMAYGDDAVDAERWARIDAEIDSQLEYLAGFKEKAAASFAAAETLAATAVEKIASDVPAHVAADVQADVTTALLTAAPGEVEAVVQATIEESLAAAAVDEDLASELAAAAIADDFDEPLTEELIGGGLAARASSYADAAYATFANNFAAMVYDEYGELFGIWECEEDTASCDGPGSCIEQADRGRIPLKDFPLIGSRKCLSNCRCNILPDWGSPRHPVTGKFV